MSIKTIYVNEKSENDLLANHFLSIPEDIKKSVQKRGFFLYNFIDSEELKLSIQKDFLDIINKYGLLFAGILIIPSVLMYFVGASTAILLYFGGSLLALNIFLVLYLFFISIKRQNLVRKNNYVVLTNSHISINEKIHKLDELKKGQLNIEEIENTFEEELFGKSKLKETKKDIFKQIVENIKNSFRFIPRLDGDSRESGQIVLVILGLMILYISSISIVYIFGIFIIWIFGFILQQISKQILLISGHQITSINDKFEKIDVYSKQLTLEKENLNTLLKSAINDDWKDSLLTEINKGIEEINKNALDSINTNLKLKDEIIKSSYKQMFDFSIYNNRIKNEIKEPLSEIKNLLLENKTKIETKIKEIGILLKTETENSRNLALDTSKKRLEMRMNQLDNYIGQMDIYLNKLK